MGGSLGLRMFVVFFWGLRAEESIVDWRSDGLLDVLQYIEGSRSCTHLHHDRLLSSLSAAWALLFHLFMTPAVL